MAIIPVNPIPSDQRLYTNITPFTVRDNATYLIVLEEMRQYINSTLVPFINVNISNLDEAWTEKVAELIQSWNDQSDALIEQVQAIADGLGDSVEEAQAARDAAEAARDAAEQFASDMQAFQDIAVSTIVSDEQSQTRAALDGLYASVQSVADAFDAIATLVSRTDAVEADITSLDTRMGDAETTQADHTERLNRIVYPSDFGAVGDGVADDTNAWNEFQESDGVKFIMPGAYYVDGEIKRFNFGVFGNGQFVDDGSAWDQARGDRERHAIIVHRNDIDGELSNIGPIIKTQTHTNLEIDEPQPASFKHVIGGYHEATLDGYYNISSDTNQNFTVFGSATRNRMAGLFGTLATLAYVEDATETEQPLISTMGATKNGGQFIRFTRRALHASGGYMFGQEIYAQNKAEETDNIPYENSDYFSFDGAWTAGIKIMGSATGAPISTGIFTHGSGGSKHGFWNGIVIGGSGFRINGNGDGADGTVGLNLSSWRPGGGYGDIGIKFRTANRHLHFVSGAKIRSSHTRFNHELGSAGVSIEAQSGSVPYLNFRTGATAAAEGGNVTDQGVIDASTSRIRIRGAGEVHLDAGGTIFSATSARFGPAASENGSLHLGGGDRRWNTIYAVNGTISTSDQRSKTDVSAIPDIALDAWGDVKYAQYRLKDAVASKGGEARLHTGIIAQKVVAAFESRGLKAADYGLLCFDKWDASLEKVTEYEVTTKEAVYEQVITTPATYSEVPTENGETERIESMPPVYGNGKLIEPAVTEKRREVVPARAAGSQYGIRYEEALSFESAYQRRRADRLESRIERLEKMMSV